MNRHRRRGPRGLSIAASTSAHVPTVLVVRDADAERIVGTDPLDPGDVPAPPVVPGLPVAGLGLLVACGVIVGARAIQWRQTEARS